MAILLKETKFSQLSIPEAGYILFGIDSETGNIKYVDSTGESKTISIDVGGDITGDSIVVGTIVGTPGTYYLANGLNVQPLSDYAHAEGRETIVTSSADYAHAEGYKTTASAEYAHSQGEYTTAAGEASMTGGIGSASYLVIASASASVNISSTSTRTSDIAGSNSVIIGGVDNLIGISTASAIIGGRLNTINGVSNNGIFVGISNTINNTSQNSVIIGGNTNTINTAGICDSIIASYNSSIASSLSYVSIIGMSGYAATTYNNVVYMPAIALVNSSTTPTVNGAIRYNGANFQGYSGGWISLERPTDYVTTGSTQSITGTKSFTTMNSTTSNITTLNCTTSNFTGVMTFPVNTNVVKNQVIYSFTTGADVTTEQIISRTYYYICANIEIQNSHVDVIYNVELDSFESSTTTLSSILLVNINSNGWSSDSLTINFRNTANTVLKTYNIPGFTGGVKSAEFTIGYVYGGTLSNRFIIIGNV